MVLIRGSYKIRSLQAFLGIWACSFLNSCSLGAGSSGAGYTTTCNIPSDQNPGTISGHWTITPPIPIAVHSGDFNSTENAAITSAANTWNAFFSYSKGENAINYGGTPGDATVSTTADSSQSGLCSNGITSGSAFSGNVVIYKLGSWPASYPSSAIALTSFCTTNATPYKSMYMALMEINYADFFVNGNKVPDLQSIVLHELGHVLGLNHSCEPTTTAGFPLCSESGINPDYISASMYPVFGFNSAGQGQVKQSLGTDDEERVNCLY